MDAGQLFPTCRERYPRLNPERVNENVAFLADDQYWITPNSTRDGEWSSFNSPDKMLSNRYALSWVLRETPFGKYLGREFDLPPGRDRLNMIHTHTTETGELYLRLSFHIGTIRNKHIGERFPIFSITPSASQGVPDVAVYLKAYSHVQLELEFEWTASNGEKVSFISPKMVRAESASRVIDVRLYIPAPSTGKWPYARMFFLGLPNSIYGADFDHESLPPPLGFKDDPGEKRISWGAIGEGAVAEGNPVGPVRLGIGNQIKYALP